MLSVANHGIHRDLKQRRFVSDKVDSPERDTVEHLALYVQNFHPCFMGLTGTLEQVNQAKNAYLV